MYIMMSPPFHHGFVHQRWTTVINVMLEKKKDVWKFYQLQIIGILEADFNTALKFLFAETIMANAKNVGFQPEQWGFWDLFLCTRV